MKKMTLFLFVVFIVVSIFFALTLLLYSFIVDSNLNVYIKAFLIAISYFIFVKLTFRIFILGPFVTNSPKYLIYPKSYLYFAIVLCVLLSLYALYSLSYIIYADYEINFVLNTIIVGIILLSIYDLLSPFIIFYKNSIKPRINFSNIEIRYGIYEDQEYLLTRDNISYRRPYKDSIYWESEFEKEK